jgi:tetratricopeptide (TPR) repeat protein
MLTTHNEVKILDFGLAKLGGGSVLTRTGTTLGTAAYMSPEQARGEQVDRRSDIWSLGAVLYELLTGQRAFLSDYEQALVYSILNDEPKQIRELRPDVPDVVEQIIGKALAKSPEERYQTAEELLADLKIARGVEAPGGTIAATEVTIKKQKKALRRSLTAAGLALVIVAMGLFIGLPLLQDQALASHPRGIAFISLENNTGDGSLEYLRNVLPGVLSTTLGDSKYIRVTRSDRMREMMKQIGKDTVEFIDRETGLLLCRRAGIDVMGVGSYTRAGPMFLAELELIDVNTGERLGSAMRARGHEAESFLKEDGIVDDLAKQISKGMGVSRLSTQATLKPVAEVSSTSLEAQVYYQRGKREYYKFMYQDARRFLELAVKKDSTFAMAWYWLFYACNDMGDRAAAKVARDQAVKKASRATERDRFMIAESDSTLRISLLKSRGTEGAGGDWSLEFFKVRCEVFPFDAEFRFWYGLHLRGSEKVTQAIAEFEKTLQLDPAFAIACNELGYCYAIQGQGDKAIQALERDAELEPGDPNPFHSMAECFIILGRYDEGIPKCEAALQVKPELTAPRLTMARLYFMKEDYDNAIRWAALAAKMAPTTFEWAYSLWWQAWYLAWSGRLRESEDVLRASEKRTSLEYQKNNLTESRKNYLVGRISWLKAWCAFENRDWKSARLHVSNWARLENLPWFAQFCLGLIDLQQGKADSIAIRLQRMRDALMAISRGDTTSSKDNEEDERVFGNALVGAYLLVTHRPAEIQPNWTRRGWLIRNPDSLSQACWPLSPPFNYNPSNTPWIPIPFDVFPRAYVERGMIDSAIASYERALKKPPNRFGPIIPRYYYRLARLYEQKGMKEKAIENYTTFLRVWGKADPVYKEPADAQVRLAKLKRL